MSSIQKIQRQSGRRYKAVLKSGSRVLKTKTFTKEALAKQWLKRMQMDAEAMDALGLKGARMTLNELVMAYKAQYQGCDASPGVCRRTDRAAGVGGCEDGVW